MKLTSKTRIAGILYISLVFVGPFTLLIFPETFMENGLLHAFNNRMPILGLWISLDLILITIEIFLTTLLYKILKDINPKLSLMAYISRLLMIVVMIYNVVLLVLMTDTFEPTLETFESLYNMHHSGIYIWQIFFFAHVLLIGHIAYKSKSIKTWIGIGLMIGAFGYILDTINYFFNINSTIVTTFTGLLLAIVAVSEIIFGIWLIINKNESLQ